MNVKTYRAASLHAALAQVRRDLGPDASVLHTRSVSGALWGWLGDRQIEVTASNEVDVPSRMPASLPSQQTPVYTAPVKPQPAPAVRAATSNVPAADLGNFREKFRRDLLAETAGDSLVEQLAQSHNVETPSYSARRGPLAEIERQLRQRAVSPTVCRDLCNQLEHEVPNAQRLSANQLGPHLTTLMAKEFRVAGGLRVPPRRHKVAALVGPTGVGKTTTIAKLAAHFRLEEKRRVGLITVDTYRIAAVDQLRTYAEIIDLPMEVVGTPREMRAAGERFADLDLVLIDTAGRSPRDSVQLQELKALLHEAQADETFLVLSAVMGEPELLQTVNQFAPVGCTSLLLTKMDEAARLGQLLALARHCPWPIGYVSSGQAVPRDIAPAEAHRLAELVWQRIA